MTMPTSGIALALVCASFIWTMSSVQARPNVIIVQPDDLPFLEQWTPPPINPNDDPDEMREIRSFPDTYGLPNLERLRNNGLQMMQAYTASPACGTSRFTTLTGRMASRAVTSRMAAEDTKATVTIPHTKLEGTDCSTKNLAATFQAAGYRTAVMGKWHLTQMSDDEYTYDRAVGEVQECGFDTVSGFYLENLSRDGTSGNGCRGLCGGRGRGRGLGGRRNNNPRRQLLPSKRHLQEDMHGDGSYSHNMEWITYEAVKFINETTDAEAEEDRNFFMYFNPTVPHSNRDVRSAIEDFPCQNTADPNYDWGGSDPWIKGMSEDGGCQAYRETIIDRANGIESNYGKIWLDDAIGALFHALEDNGVLNNTIFLFQEDHGMGAKRALFEGGIRIPQFVHYPDGGLQGEFHGLVSTVDIAATMMDYAGITPPYDLDGKSWKDAVTNVEKETHWKDQRCLFFETERDRAVRCGCYKLLGIDAAGSSTHQRVDREGLVAEVGINIFDLCDAGGEYDTAINREADTVDDSEKESELVEALECHLLATNTELSPSFPECTVFPQTEAPTPEPSSAVTGVPTGAPTSKSTGAPTSTDLQTGCDDSSLSPIVKKTGKRNFCAWVNLKLTCHKKKFWSHCPSTCRKCIQCQDSRLRFKTSWASPTTGEPFEGIVKCHKDFKIEYCNDPDIASTCRKTCGQC